ncbi:ATP-dependent nuclease [Mesorhizobium sp. ORM6]
MNITKVIVENYRTLQRATVPVNEHLNIIVGDNECGKSTLLEAINLCLTGLLNGRSIIAELHPYLFNVEAVAAYIASLTSSKPLLPPQITIELYFKDDAALTHLKGTNNSLNEDVPGLRLTILFNEAFKPEFAAYVTHMADVRTLPVEYYRVEWNGFSGNPVTARSIPTKCTFIDASIVRNTASANKYVVDIVRDVMNAKQQAELSLAYRKMKNTFLDEPSVSRINTELAKLKGHISGKDITVSLDNSSKGNWDAGIMPHLNDIPITLIGKGEQNSVKIRLAMNSSADSHLFLLEEPENHLSFSNLNVLIDTISEAYRARQIIMSTHSSFVLNKLGVENAILFKRGFNGKLSDLEKATHRYFMKLPGHDTLRLILSKKAILVEGPSDELVVQKAYYKQHKKMPLADGVDVITVNSLAFARFWKLPRY